MPTRSQPGHFVVDGSNIATEGRAVPSLTQLNEAVLAFIDTYPNVVITVVVDATFGHRIDKAEVKAFDEAVANNELVTPPAGAVGRGDAFVLAIADRAKAGVLSNDSFQEFHGDYDWLFDAGRLVGGKPVPNVGWVFVDRSPVRGARSRQSVREAKVAPGDVTADKRRAAERVRVRKTDAAPGTTDAPAELPAADASPASGRPARGRGRARAGTEAVAQAPAAAVQPATAPATATIARGPVNDVMPFLEFVGSHPVGARCSGVVDSYQSHGAYARVGEVLVYVPLRLMGDPPPQSARKTLQLGDPVDLVVVGFTPERRSIDGALAVLAGKLGLPEPEAKPATSRGRRTRATAIAEAPLAVPESAPAAPAAPAPRGRKGRGAAAPAITATTVVEPAVTDPELVTAGRRSRQRRPLAVPAAEAVVEAVVAVAPEPVAHVQVAEPVPPTKARRSSSRQPAAQPVQAVPVVAVATPPKPARAAKPKQPAAPNTLDTAAAANRSAKARQPKLKPVAAPEAPAAAPAKPARPSRPRPAKAAARSDT